MADDDRAGGAHNTDAGPDGTGASADRTGAGADRRALDWDHLLVELATEPVEDGWVTLSEAAGAAGVSLSTLRSWYRGAQVPSRMVAGLHGPQRIVPLGAVLDRALRSSRARHQLERARSVEAEIDFLRARVAAIERHLGLS